jgi:exosortase
MAFPLRMLSAKMATGMLNAVGLFAMRHGSAIWVGPGGEGPLDVADPCSGLRSLLAMTALTAVYAYFTQKTLLKKWLLFLFSIPLAVFGNIARIATIALMSQAVGRDIALGLYHDYSGYILFTASIILMIAIGALLNLNYGELYKKCKRAIINPT